MTSGVSYTLIFVASSFAGGALLFLAYAGLRRIFVPRKAAASRSEAFFIPLCLGGMVCGLYYAISIDEPGPFGEVIFFAIYLTAFFLPPFVAGSVFARRMLLRRIADQEQSK